MKKVLLTHLIEWICASALWFLFSEIIVKLIAPGYDSVELWLAVNAVGLGLILAIAVVSCLVYLKKRG
jgi:hypothetical protein